MIKISQKFNLKFVSNLSIWIKKNSRYLLLQLNCMPAKFQWVELEFVQLCVYTHFHYLRILVFQMTLDESFHSLNYHLKIWNIFTKINNKPDVEGPPENSDIALLLCSLVLITWIQKIEYIVEPQYNKLEAIDQKVMLYWVFNVGFQN